jgi:hypothetical protein
MFIILEDKAAILIAFFFESVFRAKGRYMVPHEETVLILGWGFQLGCLHQAK